MIIYETKRRLAATGTPSWVLRSLAPCKKAVPTPWENRPIYLCDSDIERRHQPHTFPPYLPPNEPRQLEMVISGDPLGMN